MTDTEITDAQLQAIIDEMTADEIRAALKWGLLTERATDLLIAELQRRAP